MSRLKKIDWTNLLFLILNPAVTFIALGFYLYYIDLSLATIAFALVFAIVTNLSITVGYHRHFAHKSFKTNSFVQFWVLFFGASAFQGSALKWSSDHRIHHRHEDTENDPYSITKGFWHAHIGWLVNKDYVDKPIHAPDLQKNFLVNIQHKYYVAWSITAGYLFPALVAWAWGDFFGGLIIAGGLRIFLTQQSTFFVNSICHFIGNKPYSTKITARDSWFVAFLTHGEGYHNFHHKFQYDYRNGIKWYHWDPTKWTIQILEKLKMASHLRTVSQFDILKAQMAVKLEMLEKKNQAIDPIVLQLKEKVLEAQKKVQELKKSISVLKEEYEQKKDQLKDQGAQYKAQLAELKEQINLEMQKLQRSLNAWNQLVLA